MIHDFLSRTYTLNLAPGLLFSAIIILIVAGIVHYRKNRKQ